MPGRSNPSALPPTADCLFSTDEAPFLTLGPVEQLLSDGSGQEGTHQLCDNEKRNFPRRAAITSDAAGLKRAPDTGPGRAIRRNTSKRGTRLS
jgi:hypothetical protein